MQTFITIIFSLLVICSFTNQTLAQETPTLTPQRSMREIVMMPVVYRVAGMDKVKVKSNLKYSSVNNPNLLMDIIVRRS